MNTGRISTLLPLLPVNFYPVLFRKKTTDVLGTLVRKIFADMKLILGLSNQKPFSKYT